MRAPSQYLRIEVQDHTDKFGRVHCWMCGTVIPGSRRHGRYTLLCAVRHDGRIPCMTLWTRERCRRNMAALRMRRAILAGRLPGPPLSTTYEQALRSKVGSR